ncbi:ParB N-terminal domain-containing protein [Poseidonocella sp. HB161398]|uniref:ParB/RepB/Spo0J family partition protein n=1 Tax=Poseidonocella sp. HB161398 TaxID=2320855 RepID=UPI001108202E|nr:ParB N-terminal domain-containing protein [Poseidonocella sp. HB161398]
MARRRLTPAQPGARAPGALAAPETKAMPFGAAPPIAKVSGQSAEAAALRELAEGIEAARAEGRMLLDIPLAEISAGFMLRDRVVFDREELDALKESIRLHGQRTPAEVTPLQPGEAEPGSRYGLISGWRRLRALGELSAETGEPRFAALRALVRPAETAADSYVAMIEENEIRVGLSYYERARVVAETAARGVFPDQAAALRALFATASRAKRSKISSFVEIHETLGDLLRFPAAIPERLGLALVAELRASGPGAARAALAAAEPGGAAEELAQLERLARPAKPPARRAAEPAAEQLRPGVEMRLSGRGGRRSVTLSGPGVDEALLETLRRILRDGEGRG